MNRPAPPEAPPDRRLELFGLGIDPVDQTEAVARVARAIDERRPFSVITPNVDFVMLAQREPALLEVFRAADLVLCDSMPLLFAARLQGARLPERVTGSDLFPRLCAEAARRGWRVFLLGGEPGIPERTAEVLRRRHPGLRVVGCASPAPGLERRAQESCALAARITALETDLLFVALGTPMQERWLYEFRDRLGSRVGIGVGASFDFIAGRQRRAPRWMQRAGLEWLYRLVRDPRRLWRRYLVRDLPFAWLALRDAARGWRDRRRRPPAAGTAADGRV